jgi:NAD(P)-dependent dehydrogenase (short-subunit alcohol dehydrogenase family)
VALVARSLGRLEELGAALQAEGVTAGWAPADLTDSEVVTAAVTRFAEHTGRLDVIHFNPSTFRQRDPLHLTVAELLQDVHLGAGALLTVVQAARPFLSAGARVLATGSMAADHPWHEAASLGVQKAALRNLVRSLDATLAPDGIRAASLTVAGTLGESEAFSPARIAEALFDLARTPNERWEAEVTYRG